MSESKKQIWLITGASQGFGRSMTERVLSSGDIAIACVRKPESMSALTSQYPPTQLLVLKMDVNEDEDVSSGFSKAKEVFGRIDVVFNNAGYSLIGETEGVPLDKAKALFETNFWGAIRVSNQAVAFFRDVNQPRGGRLITTCSSFGLYTVGSTGYYAATKFALEGLTEALHQELSPSWNIHVTLLETGAFRTDFVKNRVFDIYTHPAYTDPNVNGYQVRASFDTMKPEDMTGDPDKVTKKVQELSKLEKPPFRLLLGKDAWAGVEAKRKSTWEEWSEYRNWSDDLEFDQ